MGRALPLARLRSVESEQPAASRIHAGGVSRRRGCSASPGFGRREMQPDNRALPVPALLACVLAAAAFAYAAVSAQPPGDVEMSGISGDRKAPRRHFRLRGPASLAPGEAQRIYDIALKALAAGYARSGVPSAGAYAGWRRYNKEPYLSSTHGNDSERVDYCIGCHLAVEAQDHLYFVPPAYRAKNTD